LKAPLATIVGVGASGFKPSVPEFSTRELMFEAATRAYDDARIDPRKDVGSFISTSEDLWEGWSITDEMVPDQIGGAGKPVCTIPGDAITGLGNAVMHIAAGLADVVVLEAHSKVGDVVDTRAVEELALEPTLVRPLGISIDALAAMEMSKFFAESGLGIEECDCVIDNSRKKAARNALSSYRRAGNESASKRSELISAPLRRVDKAPYADAAVVLVIASNEWARRKERVGVKVEGVAWSSSQPWFDGGDVAVAGYARDSFGRAISQAGLAGLDMIDFVEVDDSYSFKALQHLLGISGGVDPTLEILGGDGPSLNPSGGSLAAGNLIEASAAHRIYESVLQLRGRAGAAQVKGASRGLVQSWRGNPTATGGVAILSV